MVPLSEEGPVYLKNLSFVDQTTKVIMMIYRCDKAWGCHVSRCMQYNTIQLNLDMRIYFVLLKQTADADRRILPILQDDE
jgi:hypothetical protein